MHKLHISLLGDFRLVYGAELLTSINTPRLQALLVYLLLHRQAPQARQQIAFQFWPDSSEKQAHTNLRKLLFQLRNALPDPDRFLTQDHLTVHWRPDAPYTLDVAEVQAALTRCFTAAGKLFGHATADELSKVVNLYQGELFPGCFDEWLLPLRQQLHGSVINAIEQLITLTEHQREYQAGIRYAQRLLGLDPLHEGTYRRLMQLHALNGDRAAALHNYHTCATILQQELGVEPDEETRTLYQRLLTPEGQPSQPSTRLLDAPLVGRGLEWQTLLMAWRTAQRGQAHFVSIAGEAGIGKTRLVEELLSWVGAQGIRHAHTRSYEAEGGLAYAPVTEWLRTDALKPSLKKLDKSWLSEVVRLLPELLTEQPTLMPPAPLTESWQRQRFWEALARAVLTEKTPLLLFIDDLQWCDAETLTWLRFLLRFDLHARLLIVGAWRTEAVDERHPLRLLLRDLQNANQLTTIEVGALTPDETSTLARHLSGDAMTTAAIQQLYQVTEGHPLFVVETVRANRQSPMTNQQALPAKVQSVIQARLTQLSGPARELAELAATIGRRFTVAVLAQASQHAEETLVRALDELWQRRIVHEPDADTYDFSHDRLREVAYQSLSQVRRRFFHRRVAAALLAVNAANLDEISAELAAHYEQAAQFDQAALYWRRASERALASYAHRTALHYLSRTLDLLPVAAQEQRFELLLTRVKLYNHEAMRVEGRSDLAALDVLANALDDGSKTAIRRRAAVLLALADFERGTGDQPKAGATAQAVAQLAEQCDAHDLAAQAYFFWGEAELNEVELFAQARRRLEKACRLAQAVGLLQTEAEVLSVLGLHSIYSGAPLAKVEAELQQSLAAYRKLGDPAGQAGALGMLAYILYTQREGNYALGIGYCEQAIELATDGWDAARFAKGNLGCLLYFLGDYQRAKAYLEGELAIAIEVQHWGAESGSRIEMGCLYMGMGDYATAQQHFNRALHLCRENDAKQQYRVKLEGHLARFYLLTGDLSRAAAHGEAAVAFARNLPDPRIQGDAFTRCGRVRASQGKLVEAADLFQQALTCFRQMEQWNHALMPLVGLAEIALRQGDRIQVQAWLELVLTHLQMHQLDRTDEELYVYMTGYRVLHELADQRSEQLLQLAHEQLQIRAASLATAEERRLFWAAPAHTEVVMAMRKADMVV